MKRILLMIGIWIALAGSVRAAEEFRLFTSTDGRTIEARIMEYNPIRNKLRIERRGKGMLWVAPDIFSASDRKYIKTWISASMFLAENNLKVSIKKVTRGSTGSKRSLKETERVCYEIRLQNRSKQLLNISNIEYRYYVRNITTRGGTESERVVNGTLNVAALKPNQATVVHTSILSLLTNYKRQTETYHDNYGNSQTDRSTVKLSEDKLRGIWFRLYGPEVDGQRLYRDITYPKDLLGRVEF